MDIVTLARIQFAMTTIFHFFFVPFSIGTGVVVAIMETLYVIKKDEKYRRMTKVLGKYFSIKFCGRSGNWDHSRISIWNELV